MKTRTLLLLALACGLMIMLAGAVLLVQLANQDETSAPEALGEQIAIGDMAVTVEAAREHDGVLDVAVRVGGVEDPDGAASFRLIAGGRAVPLAATGTTCASTTVAVVGCVLVFDLAGVDGSSRVLLYERGDDRARWRLD